MKNRGRTIKLFLVDGTPTGLRMAEIHNWTGQIINFPRSKTTEATERPEARRPGVYFLSGQNPDQPSQERIYIGEGDNVARRLRDHASDAGKEFWQFATMVTSKDANLTKAHVRYLEARLIELARNAGRADVVNDKGGTANLLPDSDISDMEFFLDQIEVILPVVGMGFLRSKKVRVVAESDDQPAATPNVLMLELIRPKHDVNAFAVETDGEFVVGEGSLATAYDGHSSNGYSNVRDALIKQGQLKLTDDGKAYRFEEDTPFRSPSEAAAVILNRNANGRTEWKVQGSAMSLRDWQEIGL